MITGPHDGERCTAKRYAKDMLAIDFEILSGYWSERREDDYDKMTERERHQVNQQIRKLENRIRKILDWEPFEEF